MSIKEIFFFLLKLIVDYRDVVKIFFLLLAIIGIALAVLTIYSFVKKRSTRFLYSVSTIAYFFFCLSFYLFGGLLSLTYQYSFMYQYYIDHSLESNLSYYLNFPRGDADRARLGGHILEARQYALNPLFRCLNQERTKYKQQSCLYLLEEIMKENEVSEQDWLKGKIEIAKKEYDRKVKYLTSLMNGKEEIKTKLKSLLNSQDERESFYAAYFLKKYYNEVFSDDYFKKFEPLKKDLIWPEDLK